MDELIVVLLITILAILGGLSVGFSLSTNSVIRDCEIAGQFRKDNTVYLCEKKK